MPMNIFFAGIAILAVCLQTAGAAAPSYPARPIRMIAPISAGGGADVAARLLAKSLTETLQQQIIIDNRPGGGSVIGTTAATSATPDGYTILWISGAHAINAAFARNLPYDSIKSFELVTLFAKMPFVLVTHPSLNAKTMPELLALLRAHPGAPEKSVTHSERCSPHRSATRRSHPAAAADTDAPGCSSGSGSGSGLHRCRAGHGQRGLSSGLPGLSPRCSRVP